MAPYFVPETTTLDDQMREFLRRRAHFALVVDEYGGLQGLITGLTIQNALGAGAGTGAASAGSIGGGGPNALPSFSPGSSININAGTGVAVS